MLLRLRVSRVAHQPFRRLQCIIQGLPVVPTLQVEVSKLPHGDVGDGLLPGLGHFYVILPR